MCIIKGIIIKSTPKYSLHTIMTRLRRVWLWSGKLESSICRCLSDVIPVALPLYLAHSTLPSHTFRK